MWQGIAYLTPEQISVLSTPQIQKIGLYQWTETQIKHLCTEQIQAINPNAFEEFDVVVFSPDQIPSFTSEQIQKIGWASATPAQIARLLPTQIPSIYMGYMRCLLPEFSDNQIETLSSEQISNLRSIDLSRLTILQISAFTSEHIRLFSPDMCMFILNNFDVAFQIESMNLELFSAEQVSELLRYHKSYLRPEQLGKIPENIREELSEYNQ